MCGRRYEGGLGMRVCVWESVGMRVCVGECGDEGMCGRVWG